MEKEYCIMKKRRRNNMKEIGKKTSKMDMVFCLIKMVIRFMKETGRIILQMVWVLYSMIMVKNDIMVNGRMVNGMEREF